MRRVKTVVTVDDQTGEVKDMMSVYVSEAKKEPAYVKMYMDGIEMLYNMRSYCWPVLIWMVKRMAYSNAGQYFEFGAPMRRMAGEELGVSVERINHAVSELVKAGAVLRVDRGLYQFSPMIFGRGEWKDIAKLREAARRNAVCEKNPANNS